MARGRPFASKSCPLKRALSPESKTLTPPSRQSKRLKSSPVTSSAAKVTPKKSQFFTQESTASAPASEIEDEASGYEDEDEDEDAFAIHDADYRQSKKDWDAFVEKMTEKMTEIDETIPELPAKDLVRIDIQASCPNPMYEVNNNDQTFRIYRDVRFSPDQTPYKTHFAAAWSRTGRKGPYAGYYLQIKPSGSFIGGGLWCPEAAPLAAMRRDIDRKSHKLKNVLLDPLLRKEFLGGVSKDDKKAVKAFCGQNQENALKTKPKVRSLNLLLGVFSHLLGRGHSTRRVSAGSLASTSANHASFHL
ncbi:MAG: hypothetical protein Q9173_006471 [Seirophora scorigena]